MKLYILILNIVVALAVAAVAMLWYGPFDIAVLPEEVAASSLRDSGLIRACSLGRDEAHDYKLTLLIAPQPAEGKYSDARLIVGKRAVESGDAAFLCDNRANWVRMERTRNNPITFKLRADEIDRSVLSIRFRSPLKRWWPASRWVEYRIRLADSAISLR